MSQQKNESLGVMLRLPADLLESVDALRRDEADIPTRPEMIRRIIARYLETAPRNE